MADIIVIAFASAVIQSQLDVMHLLTEGRNPVVA